MIVPARRRFVANSSSLKVCVTAPRAANIAMKSAKNAAALSNDSTQSATVTLADESSGKLT